MSRQIAAYLILILLITGCNGPETASPSSTPSVIETQSTPTHTGGGHTPAAHATASPLPDSAFTPSATITIQIDSASRFQTFQGC